jgi:hypothetical protein
VLADGGLADAKRAPGSPKTSPAPSSAKMPHVLDTVGNSFIPHGIDISLIRRFTTDRAVGKYGRIGMIDWLW